MKQYIINVWTETATSCIYRTEDREKFFDKILEVQKAYKIKPGNARICEYANYVIFSFPDNKKSLVRWRFTDFVRRPLSVDYI